MRRAPLLLLLALCVPAQEPIRVETQLVNVEVVVRGPDGPIDNLTADDFTLYDAGKKQKIAFFSILRETRQPAQRPLGSTATSNRLYRDDQPVAPTVILLDTLNSLPQDMVELRRQLGIYLDQEGLQEPIAIYHLNTTLSILQNFTGDLARLKQIVQRWAAPSSINMNWEEMVLADLPTTGDPITIGMAEAAAKEGVDMGNLRRAENTTFALKKIAEHLSGIPGRKRLIWAGGSFPAITSELRSRLGKQQIEVRYYNEPIEKAVRALNEAQIAVYPIDPRRPPSLINPGLDTMNLIASGTGGKARYGTVDLTGAIKQAMEDSLITYQLGFYPQKTESQPKFHSIDVKVARKDTDVRHRSGYLAVASKPPDGPEQSRLLRTALESPLDMTGLGLAAVPLAVPVGEFQQFLLRLDARDLSIQTERTAKGTTVWTALITVATSFPDEPKLSGLVNELKLTFTEERLRELLKEGYLLRLQANQQAKSKRFRVVVLDRTTGRNGSLTLSLAK